MQIRGVSTKEAFTRLESVKPKPVSMPKEMAVETDIETDVDSFVTERFNVFETILKEYTKSVDVIPTTPTTP